MRHTPFFCPLLLSLLQGVRTVAWPTFTTSPYPVVSRQLSVQEKTHHPSQPPFECPTQLGLPRGDLQFLVVTDIHGWIAGQHARHEPEMDVDFGALLSFYERLQECAPDDTDWFLLFNGDFMDGTGLSTIPPQYLAPLLQEMPFSALNLGNHEIYFREVVDYLMREGGFVDHWQGTFLASNSDYIRHAGTGREKMIPLGDRYTILEGPNTDTSILVFGFLFNFEDNCNNTRVRTVEDTLQEDWFLDALNNEQYDVIVVLAHMDVVDPLVYTILEAIRGEVGDEMPIQFFTGHTHHRGYETLDPLATSMEAGRYMDTIGFASLSLGGTNHTSPFQYEQLDTSIEKLTTGVFQNPPGTDFSTEKGRALTKQLQDTERDLGLLDVLTTCAPKTTACQRLWMIPTLCGGSI
jgi:2',3'-cyclic-nucleotide 2'-phosphodiesterase (5'-nucleotidase family)